MNRVLGIIVLSWVAWGTAAGEAAATGPASQPSNLTFFIIADTHFGAKGMEEANRGIVRVLNNLPGTDYPESVGGKVGKPRAVLHLGDITDNGLDDEWEQYVKIYGRTGQDAELKWPILETIGNHDMTGGEILKKVKARHGGLPYTWDWEGIHFVMLDTWPDAEGVKFLKEDLSRVGRQQPVILLTHYPMAGPYSNFWKEEEKEAFGAAIEGFNVIGIFHGHYHRAGRYLWKGYHVFRTGSPRHSSHQLIVVRVKEGKMSVCWWDWDKQRWEAQAVTKSIAPATRPATTGVAEMVNH